MTQYKALDKRSSRIREEKRRFAERRFDFYKRHADSGFIDFFERGVSNREPLPIDAVKRRLVLGNERIVILINDMLTELGKLEDPQPGTYSRAMKECVDARKMLTTALDLLMRRTIHERTAAAIVRRGHIFTVMNEDGVGFLFTHFGCGGEAVAHNFHTGAYNNGGERLVRDDPHMRSIVDSIPRGIASIRDPVARSEANARLQAMVAHEIVMAEGLGNLIHPAMITWENWPEVDVKWLSKTRFPEQPWINTVRENAQALWTIAATLGRTPEKQYSHTAFYYDPFRLGRINDPRAVFDLLPNEGFCVTESFKDVANGGQLSGSAVGSLRYAVSHGGEGHVLGVGTENGTRHIAILDPDVGTLHAVKEALLRSSKELADLTSNGKTITLIRYDLDTKRIEFAE